MDALNTLIEDAKQLRGKSLSLASRNRAVSIGLGVSGSLFGAFAAIAGVSWSVTAVVVGGAGAAILSSMSPFLNPEARGTYQRINASDYRDVGYDALIIQERETPPTEQELRKIKDRILEIERRRFSRPAEEEN